MKKKKQKRISFHLIFLFAVILFIIYLVYRIMNWGTRVNSVYDPNDPNEGYDIEILDNIVPPQVPAEENPANDGVTTILFLGNSPLSDDKYTENGLANIIAAQTGATIYDCSIPNSFQSSVSNLITAEEYPMDAFSLYWLTILMTNTPCDIHKNAIRILGDDIPPEALEAYDTLTCIDYNTVDVLAIMYDGADYLEKRPLIDNDNPTDIRTFYGALNASLDLLQQTYPHIRVIVMSPTYCYALGEDGEYINSDFVKVNDETFSTYAVLLERAAYTNFASYVDNIYGTINEYNAPDYLTDNIHLNLEGRKKMAERFIYALTFFD